ncbi:MAG: hypothetical protein ACU85V_00085 [Gammaproteobacteria bacterium]
MTFEQRAADYGREPVYVVELDLDFCAETYGVGACTASGAPGSECYNTFGTCQDTANFNKGTRTYRFCSDVRVPPEIDAYPCIPLSGVDITPGRALPNAIGELGKASVTFRDFPHDDVGGADPYRANRIASDLEGTFFGRMRARNKYYRGRTMRVLEGFIGAPFSWDDFRTRLYVIESVEGPDADGRVRIVGKDLLKLADDDRVKIPAPSQLEFDGSVTASGTTIVITGSGTLPAGGTKVAASGEVITLGTKSGSTYTGCTRGVGATSGKAHSDGDAIQICREHSAENVRDIIESYLTTDVGIDASYIPTAEWDAEEASSLSTLNLTALITEPVGARKLLNELCEQCGISLFFDEIEQKVRLFGNTPFSDVQPIIIEDEAIIHDSMRVRDDVSRQVTRVDFRYAIIDPTDSGSSDENYARQYVLIDAGLESANQHDGQFEKKIRSRWFTASEDAQVAVLAQRLVSRFGDPPPRLTWRTDPAKATYRLGQVADIETRSIQGVRGAQSTTRIQIIGIRPMLSGQAHVYEYEALAFFPSDEATIGDIDITTDQVDFDIYVELGGPVAPVSITVTIKAGVTVSASSFLSAALSSGLLASGSEINLVLESGAKLLGAGGPGGGWTGSGDAYRYGLPGGTALEMTCDFSLDNAGTISGGGGGGGPSGDIADGVNNVISGGGGGAGDNAGAGGSALGSGTAGSAGTETTGGAGGGSAGDGGGPGQSGQNGSVLIAEPPDVPSNVYDTTLGGSGGLAIDKNGHTLTIINMGTVNGSIS